VNRYRRSLFLVTLTASLVASLALAKDICTICNQPIAGTIYLVTDAVIGQDQMVCSNCLQLPRCFICGLPVADDSIKLADGRRLCRRDGQTAVLNAYAAQRIAAGVREELDKLFIRFTSFPANVDVDVLDRIDIDKLYQPDGYDFESPNLLGCIAAVTNASQKRYSMRLLTGLPRVELQATAAHEFSHAWVGENVPPERRARLSGNAEEGFCELVAYLLMDSQNEAAQKKFILQNHYTRGQIDLFIAAEQRSGFDQILDWMRYGEMPELTAGHGDEIRNIIIPKAVALTAKPSPLATNSPLAALVAPSRAAPLPETIRLQGILWGNPPAAIINNHTVFARDQIKLKIGGTVTRLRCLEIQKNSVRIEDLDSGKQDELHL